MGSSCTSASCSNYDRTSYRLLAVQMFIVRTSLIKKLVGEHCLLFRLRQGCGSASLFNTDLDPVFTFIRFLIRIQLLFKVMGIFDNWSMDRPGLHSEPPADLYFEPLKLLTFEFNADLDQALHFNADPDPDQLPKTTKFFLSSSYYPTEALSCERKKNRNLPLLSFYMYIS
jgi:hypothetical protein